MASRLTAAIRKRIWAVQITRPGVLWDEAALAGLTKTKVRVCYRGEFVLLNRARSRMAWQTRFLLHLPRVV